MSEEQWLHCTDSVLLLGGLPGPVGARQLRLIFCACLRSSAVWPFLASGSSRRAVAESERYADGLVRSKRLRTVRTSAHSAWSRISPHNRAAYASAELAHAACWLDPMLLREGFATLRRLAERGLSFPTVLLRDILGNPFRTVQVDPAWLRWEGGTVVRLAQSACEERTLPSGELDRQVLTVLADALEEAGCGEARLIDHLRDPGPHVRGCFALDLLLAKDRGRDSL
jgi:hypothetical protein